jgi:DNA-binding transcriptional ArsR family regulator
MPHPLEHSSAARVMNATEARSIAEDMRAFSAESRVRLLFCLVESERTVDDLAQAVEMEPSAVSQQLRILRQLRYVVATRDGRHMRYRLHDHHVGDLLTAIRYHNEHAASGWPAAEAPNRSRRATPA